MRSHHARDDCSSTSDFSATSRRIGCARSCRRSPAARDSPRAKRRCSCRSSRTSRNHCGATSDRLECRDFLRKKENSRMAAGPMSKSKIIAHIADEAEVSKKTAAKMLESLSDLAYGEAKKGFTVPGLGKLVLVNRKARMGRNPATGATIKIPAKKVVKFRIAKACKDAILGAKK